MGSISFQRSKNLDTYHPGGRSDPDKIRLRKKTSTLKTAANYSIGVEVELENLWEVRNRSNVPPTMSRWSLHNDNSLRGQHAEYVFRAPMKGDDAIEAIEELYEQYIDLSVFTSPRCSMHVHVNVLDCDLDDMIGTLAACALLDDVMFSRTNKYRRYVSFATESTQMLFKNIIGMVKTGVMDTTNSRYWSVNVQSVERHGTLEFRHFSPAKTQEEAVDLVNLCILTKKLGKETVEELKTAGMTEWSDDLLRQLFTALRTKLVDALPNDVGVLPTETALLNRLNYCLKAYGTDTKSWRSTVEIAVKKPENAVSSSPEESATAKPMTFEQYLVDTVGLEWAAMRSGDEIEVMMERFLAEIQTNNSPRGS